MMKKYYTTPTFNAEILDAHQMLLTTADQPLQEETTDVQHSKGMSIFSNDEEDGSQY